MTFLRYTRITPIVTSLLSRAPLVLCLSWICSGCTPLLDPHLQEQMKQVRINRIDDRMGQQLHTRLKNLLQTQQHNHCYNLDITLTEQSRALVLNKQGQNALTHHSLKVNYTLVRLMDERILTKGVLRLYGIKPLTASYYSQSVMDRATNERSLERASEQLRQIIALALKNQPIVGCPKSKNVVYKP